MAEEQLLPLGPLASPIPGDASPSLAMLAAAQLPEAALREIEEEEEQEGEQEDTLEKALWWRPTAAEEEVQLLPMASPILGGASPSSAKLAAPQLPEAAPREIEEEEQQ